MKIILILFIPFFLLCILLFIFDNLSNKNSNRTITKSEKFFLALLTPILLPLFQALIDNTQESMKILLIIIMSILGLISIIFSHAFIGSAFIFIAISIWLYKGT